MQKHEPIAAGLAARRAAEGLIAGVIDRKEGLDRAAGPDHQAYLDERDRQLARAIALTALRHGRRIEASLAQLWLRPPPRRARSVHHALMVAAAQILFMQVPDHVAVNIAVESIRSDRRSQRFAGFANAMLRNLVRRKEEILRATSAVSPFPDWLARQIRTGFGAARLQAIGEMIVLEPNIDLKPNPAVAFDMSRTGAIELPLGHYRLDTSDPGTGQVTALPGFDEGAWWVQDLASAIPVRLLGDVSGKRVADLCAAPGGKTMQLASLGAHVTAVDLSPARLERLRANLARTGLSAEIVEADILEWEPGTGFDAVLLDAPCSATGTIRRHPDILWNKTPEDVAGLAGLQLRMICRAARLLNPGGILVYANCSMLKAEGEDLVAGLSDDPILELDPASAGEFPGIGGIVNGQGSVRTLPCDLPMEPRWLGGMDGFFSVRFRRRI